MEIILQNMFTLERAHQLLRQQGLESKEDFEVHSQSRAAKDGGVCPTWKLLPTPARESSPKESSLGASILNSPFWPALRLVIAVAIGTTIGSLLATLL